MADWSMLPFDVLYEIAMRLDSIEDLVYFSVVCRSWNQFASSSKVKREFNVKTTPWLLLGEDTENNPDCLREVYNPYNDKFYKLKLPETFGCRCWGSAYGWLVVTDTQSLDLHLFNPLTKARMSLPPITSMPYLCYRDFPNPEPCTLWKMRTTYLNKAFVLKVDEDDFIVFFSYLFTGKELAFARPGDQSWTSVHHPRDTAKFKRRKISKLDNCVAEVICRGTQILVLYYDCSLAYLNISDLSDPQKLVVKDCPPAQYMVLTDPRNLCIKLGEYISAPPGMVNGKDFDKELYGSYMVDLYGDVFMVLRDRWLLEGEEEYGTFGFKVYRLDFDNKRWSQVDHLDDSIFFVGCGSSMSVSAARAPNCKTHGIYFGDDFYDFFGVGPIWGDDMGVFDLKNGTIDDFDDNCYTDSKVQSPLWFMPRL